MKRSLAIAAVALAFCWLAAEWTVAALDLLEVSPALSRGHPRRGYALRPGFDGVTKLGIPIHVSSLGLRSPEIEEKKAAGVRRLLVLGDSVTFGWGIREEDSFARRLEAMLRAAPACPSEVVNAGVSGYGSIEELDYFANEGVRLEPDAVLIYQVENDYMAATPRTSALAMFMKDWIFYRSYLVNASFLAYQKLRWQVAAQAAGGDTAAYAAQQRTWGSLPGAAQSLDALRKIAALAHERGIAVVLASHPNNLADPSLDAERTRLLRELAAADDLRFVDVAPAFAGMRPEALAVSETDRHPNALGHALIAGLLLPAVREALGCAAKAH